MEIKEWLVKEGYSGVMKITLDNLEIILNRYSSELVKENEQLKAWKKEAISVTPPMQEIAKAIGVKPGHFIHDKILPAITQLQSTIEEQKRGNEELISAKNGYIGYLEKKWKETSKSNDDLIFQLSYMTERCEAAEVFIAESPCDPDITSNQIEAHKNWQSLKSKEKQI